MRGVRHALCAGRKILQVQDGRRGLHRLAHALRREHGERCSVRPVVWTGREYAPLWSFGGLWAFLWGRESVRGGAKAVAAGCSVGALVWFGALLQASGGW